MSPAKRRQSAEPRPALVVHPARLLAMDAERQARVIAAVKALLIPVLRDEQAAAGGRSDPPDQPPEAPSTERAA